MSPDELRGADRRLAKPYTVEALLDAVVACAPAAAQA
jgi:hypothetical protein